MRDIRIEKAVSRKDVGRFIRFSRRVYNKDPNWIPPLIAEMKEKLDPKRNPFFEHAERALFLAREGGSLTGRIAAIVDDRHNEFHAEKAVFFGFFESLNDIDTAKALIDAAAAWGRERGMNVLRGPMNPSMNDECAFLLEGFDTPPMFMMPYNPRWYPDLMASCGMVKAKDLYAYIMNRDHDVAVRTAAVVARVRSQTSYSLRTIDMKNMKEEAEKIARIYNHGWERNWGFVPWTDNEMKHMGARLKSILDPELVVIAEHEGQPVGFALGLPNYNEILGKMNGRLFPFGIIRIMTGRRRIKSMRAVVFGLLKEHRLTGLSYLLYSEMEERARKKGYEWGELSWALEDNTLVNRFAASLGATIYKKYRIYEKSLV